MVMPSIIVNHCTFVILLALPRHTKLVVAHQATQCGQKPLIAGFRRATFPPLWGGLSLLFLHVCDMYRAQCAIGVRRRRLDRHGGQSLSCVPSAGQREVNEAIVSTVEESASPKFAGGCSGTRNRRDTCGRCLGRQFLSSSVSNASRGHSVKESDVVVVLNIGPLGQVTGRMRIRRAPGLGGNPRRGWVRRCFEGEAVWSQQKIFRVRRDGQVPAADRKAKTGSLSVRVVNAQRSSSLRKIHTTLRSQFTGERILDRCCGS